VIRFETVALTASWIVRSDPVPPREFSTRAGERRYEARDIVRPNVRDRAGQKLGWGPKISNTMVPIAPGSRGVAVLGVALIASACSTAWSPSTREGVIPSIVPSAIQLRAERHAGGRRSASGVAVAADAATARTWIVTTRHVVDPPVAQDVFATVPGRKERVKVTIRAVSADADLAILEARGIVLPAVRLKRTARLGDEVRVVAYPLGRRLSVVSGTVSQTGPDGPDISTEGPVRTIDASVTYGASGGGVFDAATGSLVGIVQSYRTARIETPGPPLQTIEVPIPGETNVVSADDIARFLEGVGIEMLFER
jgi:serine protease Do